MFLSENGNLNVLIYNILETRKLQYLIFKNGYRTFGVYFKLFRFEMRNEQGQLSFLYVIFA